MADRGGEERRQDDDEGEEEIDENDYKAQKDAVLFAIDVSSSMLKPPPVSDEKKADTDSAVTAALKCAYQIMQQRIISQPKDMIGVLLFGTEKSKFRDEEGGRAASGYPHCYLFIDLDIPAAEDVRKLKALVEDGDDPDDILKPASESVSLANVLFCANQIFTTNTPNFGSRRLFIITDNADPHSGDKSARSAAAVRAKDLYDLGVIIELFPITRGEDKFDLTKFYDDVVYRDPAAEVGASDEIKMARPGNGLTLLNALISNINSKQTPKRAYFSSLPFEIAPGLTISVKGYIILHHQVAARTCYVWLGGEKAQIAEGETTKMENDSTRSVEKAEIKKAYKFGGEYVYFAPEELQSLRKIGEKGLRIVGFKPRSMLPPWAAVKKSIFIFPSEDDYVGSTRVFSALWQKLLKDNKMAIAWFIARSNANPLLVAILPSKSQDDETSGTPFLPAGLWLYPLPFADDLRAFETEANPRASNEAIDEMRYIVQNLQLPKGMYNPAKYPNPSLQWHYKILQVLALEEEVPEHPEDATIPRYKTINKRIGGYVVDWSKTIGEGAKNLAGVRSIKREGDGDEEANGQPAKRAKTAPTKVATGGMSNAQLKLASQEGGLNKMKVVELKDILVSKNQSILGKKSELVERLEQWLEDNS